MIRNSVVRCKIQMLDIEQGIDLDEVEEMIQEDPETLPFVPIDEWHRDSEFRRWQSAASDYVDALANMILPQYYYFVIDPVSAPAGERTRGRGRGRPILNFLPWQTAGPPPRTVTSYDMGYYPFFHITRRYEQYHLPESYLMSLNEVEELQLFFDLFVTYHFSIPECFKKYYSFPVRLHPYLVFLLTDFERGTVGIHHDYVTYSKLRPTSEEELDAQRDACKERILRSRELREWREEAEEGLFENPTRRRPSRKGGYKHRLRRTGRHG